MNARLLVLTGLALALAGCATPGGGGRTAQSCLLSVEETAGTLAIVDSQGEVVKRVTIGERPHEVAVSPDRRLAYVSQFGIADYDSRIGTPGDRVVEIDLITGARSGDFVLPADVRGPHGVKLRPGGSDELFVNAEVGGDTMLVFDRVSHHLLRRFPLPAATHNFIFSQDGASIFSFAGAAGASRIDARDGRVLARQYPGSPIRGLFVTSGGMVLASARGEILELRPADLAIIRRLPAPRPGQFVYLEQWPDGMIAAPSLADGGVAIFPPDGGPARFAATGKTPIIVRRGPDGLIYVANVEDDHISVIDAQGETVRTITGLTAPNGLAFGFCPRKGAS